MKNILWISLFLFSCGSIKNIAKTNSEKSNLYKKMFLARDAREGFTPYNRYDIDSLSLLGEYNFLKKYLKNNQFYEQLYSIVNDTFFVVSEDYILSRRKKKHFFSPELLVTSQNFEKITPYLQNIRICQEKIQKLINLNKNLYKIIVYSGENEIHLFNQAFLYEKAYEPRIATPYNYLSKRVLDELFFDEINLPTTKVGFYENKYEYSLTIPLIYKNKYIGDLSAYYLKNKGVPPQKPTD